MKTNAAGRLAMGEKQNIELIAQWDAEGQRFIMSARLVGELPVPIKNERKRWRMAKGKTVVHLVPVDRGIFQERAKALLTSFMIDPLLMVLPEQLALPIEQGS